MNDSEILSLIKEARGISIFLGRNIEGGDYWTVTGGFVNAGGYSTLDEAIEVWAKTQKKYKERNNEK